MGVVLAAGTMFWAAPGARADLPAGTLCDLPQTGADSSEPWAQQRLDPQSVWPLSTGAGVTVAVVDTGVDIAQPFLRGHVLPGIDVVNGGTADTDCVGHGTLVAGLIAGQQLPGYAFEGIAPGATILPVRQADTEYDGTADALAAGITAAVDAGASVVNVSITTSQPALSLAKAVQYAQDHNVVVVAAAGNDQQSGNAALYPASMPGVLSVGAVDQAGQATAFSQTGTVSVAAPGQAIVGPGAGGTGLVAGAQGTSFAAPFVAGVVALVRAYHPNLTASQVIRRIEITADHPPGALPNPQTGWGVVDPYTAVTAILPEEQGAVAHPVPATVVVPQVLHAPDDTTVHRALALAGVGAALALAVPAVALTARRIKRTHGQTD